MALLSVSIFSLSVTSQTQAATAVIDAAHPYQLIDGFGFCTAWCGTLTTAKNNALYGTLGMSLLRVRIDENSTNYWSDEINNSAAAHAAGARVLGCAWSAPATMKDTNANIVLPAQYHNYALWLNQAVTAMNLDFCSVQNEPDMDPAYGGGYWTGTNIETFCANEAQNIGCQVAMADAVGFTDSVSDPTLNDPVAASHVAIACGHFYGNGNYVHSNALAQGKRVWMTEHYIDNARSDFSGACITMAKEINDAMYNQFSAYIWWWVNDYDTNMNLVMSDGTIFKDGYVLGQYAKWIRPNAARIDATYNPSTNVYVTAYRNTSGQAVIVALNVGSNAVNQKFTITNSSVTSVIPYRTSSTENMATLSAISASRGSFTTSLPALSITTFVQSNTPSTLASGTYKIINRNSGLAAEAYASSITNGTPIDQWAYLAGSNQKWTVTNLGNNLYSIIGVQSGRALDIYNGLTANGAKTELWDYWGGPMQTFILTPTGSGYYRITPTHAIGSCLDVAGASTANGATVWLWTWLYGLNQQWSFQAP